MASVLPVMTAYLGSAACKLGQAGKNTGRQDLFLPTACAGALCPKAALSPLTLEEGRGGKPGRRPSLDGHSIRTKEHTPNRNIQERNVSG